MHAPLIKLTALGLIGAAALALEVGAAHRVAMHVQAQAAAGQFAGLHRAGTILAQTVADEARHHLRDAGYRASLGAVRGAGMVLAALQGTSRTAAPEASIVIVREHCPSGAGECSSTVSKAQRRLVRVRRSTTS